MGSGKPTEKYNNSKEKLFHSKVFFKLFVPDIVQDSACHETKRHPPQTISYRGKYTPIFGHSNGLKSRATDSLNISIFDRVAHRFRLSFVQSSKSCRKRRSI